MSDDPADSDLFPLISNFLNNNWFNVTYLFERLQIIYLAINSAIVSYASRMIVSLINETNH